MDVRGKALVVHKDITHLILTSKQEDFSRLIEEYTHAKDTGLALAKAADLDLSIFAVVHDVETGAVICLEAIDLSVYLAHVATVKGWGKENKVA